MRLYEGMYIASMELASQGWDKVEETVKDTIVRFDGEIVRIRKWGERRFTYPIHKQVKGLYVLVHFNAEPAAIENIKARVELESDLLRVLIIRMPEEYAEESFAKDSDHLAPGAAEDDFTSSRDRSGSGRKDDTAHDKNAGSEKDADEGKEENEDGDDDEDEDEGNEEKKE